MNEVMENPDDYIFRLLTLDIEPLKDEFFNARLKYLEKVQELEADEGLNKLWDSYLDLRQRYYSLWYKTFYNPLAHHKFSARLEGQQLARLSIEFRRDGIAPELIKTDPIFYDPEKHETIKQYLKILNQLETLYDKEKQNAK